MNEVGDPFESRRAALIRTLLADRVDLRAYQPEPTGGRETASVHLYSKSYRQRLALCHVLLKNGESLDQANAYLESHEDLVAHWWNHPRNEPDWKIGPLLCIWFDGGSRINPQARTRLSRLFHHYRDDIAFGGTENHIINRVVLCLLCDEALCHADEKTRLAGELFEQWVEARARRGLMEYNSPTYQQHDVIPLLQMFDYSPVNRWRESARQLLDVMMAMLIAQSIDGVRGGPWHRATSPLELADLRHNTAWILSHFFLGNCPPPLSLNHAIWVTTTYRPSAAVQRLADTGSRPAVYDLRQRVDTVEPELNARFHVTPAFMLGSFQNEPPFICHYYGSNNLSNLHPWQLTFADPEKILGVARSLDDVSDYQNRNTSLAQYGGGLFFRGGWMDYNRNLGTPEVIEDPGRRRTLFRIPTPHDEVRICITEYPASGLGVLEAVTRSNTLQTDEDWRASVVKAEGNVSADGCFLHHTNLRGERLEWERGSLKVNGEAVSLRDYPLCDAPFLRSAWDSGVIELGSPDHPTVLDFGRSWLGAPRGLKAEYFSDPDFQQLCFQRQDQTLDYIWGEKHPVTGSKSGFSVRWSGVYHATLDGCHLFKVITTGEVRLVIDGRTLVETKPGSELLEQSGAVSLCRGRAYPLCIEYRCREAKAHIIVRHSTRLQPFQALGLLREIGDGEAATV